MRRSIAILAFIVASLVASAVSAADCIAPEMNQKGLDWRRGPDKRPLTSLALRVIAENCTEKLKNDSFYFEGFSTRDYPTEAAVKIDIEAVRNYMALVGRVGPEELKKMVAFIEKSDKEFLAAVADKSTPASLDARATIAGPFTADEVAIPSIKKKP